MSGPSWRDVHPPNSPHRPWGYGARPLRVPAARAASRGLQLLLAATLGAAGYAYYHKLYGYPCEHQHQHQHQHQQQHQHQHQQQHQPASPQPGGTK